VITRTQLDRMAAAGCADPDCDHVHEPLSEIYFHSRCHPEAGTDVVQIESGLGFHCHGCGKRLAGVLVKVPPLSVSKVCHPDEGVESLYTVATGRIGMRCNECKALIAEVEVASEVDGPTCSDPICHSCIENRNVVEVAEAERVKTLPGGLEKWVGRDIKKSFPVEPGTQVGEEFMWCTVLGVAGDSLRCRLMSQPACLTYLQQNDIVEVTEDEIWACWVE
jgi:hypothetical protein